MQNNNFLADWNFIKETENVKQEKTVTKVVLTQSFTSDGNRILKVMKALLFETRMPNRNINKYI